MSRQVSAKAEASSAALLERARCWFDGALGRFLLRQEQQLLEQELARYFGGFMVAYGPAATLPRAEKIQRSVRLGPPLPGVEIACQEEAWPLCEYAADVVLLQHGLDFCLSPHGLLREAARSVRPGGHLVVVGINPWSAWGMRKAVSLGTLGKARCIPQTRISDWLNLLGFLVERRLYGGYCPPISAPRWQARLAGMERWGGGLGALGAGFYVLAARKLVLGLRPVQQRQREPRGQLLPLPVAKISRRDSKPSDCK